MSTLGVLILSVSGMNRLSQCLESVGWADAIMVVHVGGGEPKVGSNLSPTAVIRKARSIVELGKMGREVKTDWVLRLWGEEQVGTALKEELHCVSKRGGLPLTYRVPIRSRVLDRWVQGSLWGPSPACRFSSIVDDLSPEWWNLRQEKRTVFPEPLKGWVDDYTLEDLAGGFERIHHISDLWAEHLNAAIPQSVAAMALRPLSVFLGSMWMNGLISHGLAGLTFSTLAAYATLLSGAKAWESRNASGKENRQS